MLFENPVTSKMPCKTDVRKAFLAFILRGPPFQKSRQKRRNPLRFHDLKRHILHNI
jgi:hypothetical protein